MSNISKLDFSPLDITGNNYLSWVRDVESHLEVVDNVDAITEGNQLSFQDKAKAMIFIRHHIHEDLKNEYLTVTEPQILWKNLKERYEHRKLIILPKSRYDWINLRFQDFKIVNEYNSALLKITSKLMLCGENISDEEMIEKTFTTFHASDMLLQQQYQEQRFTRYNELISCLLFSEQNNVVLLKNHQNRPTGSTPFPEANVTTYNESGRGRGCGRGRGRGRGNGGRNNKWHRGWPNNFFKNNQPHHEKWNNNGASSSQHQTNEEKGKDVQNKNSKKNEYGCFKCGMKNHWARICRTPKHLTCLYQESIKEKGKGVEINFASIDKPLAEQEMNINHVNEPTNPTHFEANDFFED